MARTALTRFVFNSTGPSYEITVSGPLDGSAASSLRCLLDDLARDHVAIDLRACTSVTDDALTALVAASRNAAARGGSLHLEPTR